MVQIIAELGINHNGDFDLLCSMAMEAKKAGADYVKIQKREIEWCYTGSEMLKPCDSPWGSTVGEKVRGREFNWAAIKAFDSFCKKNGIEWTSSCFDLKSLAFLNESFNIPFNKVPSALASWKVFLEAVASYRKLTLISTGLCDGIDEIKKIATLFQDAKCPFVLNHCVALYPCPPERLDLDVITSLQFLKDTSEFFFPLWSGIGYSGHEVGILPSVIAAQMGIDWLERHFTLDRSMYGSDQAASMEPQGFARMVRDIRQLKIIKGIRRKYLRGDEKNPVKFRREE